MLARDPRHGTIAEASGKNKELRQRGDDLNNPRHANVSGILTGHRESFRRGGGDRWEKKKDEPTRQSANLHTAHTGEEALSLFDISRGDDRIISFNDS